MPIAVSGSGHQKTNRFIGRCRHPYARKLSSKALRRRMQLTLFHATRPTPHGASRSAQAKSAWSVKTRRAPSRHCRESRVYGHATTVILSIGHEYTPPRRVEDSKAVPRNSRSRIFVAAVNLGALGGRVRTKKSPVLFFCSGIMPRSVGPRL